MSIDRRYFVYILNDYILIERSWMNSKVHHRDVYQAGINRRSSPATQIMLAHGDLATANLHFEHVKLPNEEITVFSVDCSYLSMPCHCART
jgi:hypothetical protein